jgi:16S rRNA (adenine1518-N6/adenine1519-N6)-dimethyltransferase
VTAPRRHRARKRFGQHFLVDPWARKVVAALAPAPGDVFLEIGPGRGALTLPLAETGAPVLAVDVDRDLTAELAARVPPNVTLLTGDVLTLDVLPFLTGLQPQQPPSAAAGPPPPRRFRAVGNLPYNLSTPILFRLIDMHRRHGLIADATLMLQREVADRLLGRAGTRDYGVLTIMVTMYARVTRLLNLPPGAFVPPPKVRSTVVGLTFGPPAVKVPDEALFERLVRSVFTQRRKTLANGLKTFDRTGPAVLALSGIDPRRRPETLTLTDLARLTELFASVRRPQ